MTMLRICETWTVFISVLGTSVRPGHQSHRSPEQRGRLCGQTRLLNSSASYHQYSPASCCWVTAGDSSCCIYAYKYRTIIGKFSGQLRFESFENYISIAAFETQLGFILSFSLVSRKCSKFATILIFLQQNSSN